MRFIHVLIPQKQLMWMLMYIHSQKKKTPLQQERRLKKRVNYFLLWKLNKMRAQIDEIFCIHAHT